MHKTRKIISTILVVAVFASQFLFISVFTAPKPASAIISIPFLGPIYSGGAATSVFTSVPEWSWHDFWKDLAIGVLRGVAEKAAQKFLTDFINKMTQKYKIRNFLYYDQVLSDYYLNRFIYDKITDPSLRQIYGLMERAYITGEPTGTTGQPDPRRALLPQLRRAISSYYIQKGGVDPARVRNPSSYNTDREYFAAAQAYFYNPVSFTEQNLQGTFGDFQSSATTAAQIEVLVGNGLKAGRVIGGTCSVPIENPTPDKCRAAGGVWQASILDQTRSFIDNPTPYILGRLDKAISEQMKLNFDPNNFWAVIGKLLGNFLFDQLALKKVGGTLPEPGTYVPTDPNESYTPQPGNGIDLDGDGVYDGYDYDNDGVIDACAFEGTPPNGCSLSTVITTPPAPPAAPAPFDALTKHPDQSAVVAQVIADLEAAGIDMTGDCGAFEILSRVAWRLSSDEAGLLDKPTGTNCQGYSIDVIAYPDGYIYDVIGNAGVSNDPQWLPVGCDTTGVCPSRYRPAFDPGPP